MSRLEGRESPMGHWQQLLSTQSWGNLYKEAKNPAELKLYQVIWIVQRPHASVMFTGGG